MQPTPKGWPRISSALFYDDAAAAIAWLCRVFDFEVRLRVDGPDGKVAHSELTYGDGLIMVGQAGAHPERRSTSPRGLGGANTQALCVCVDDADAHCAKARAAGAKIVTEPATHDYGDDYWADRSYEAEDLEGHRWWFQQRVRTGATWA